LNEKRKAVPPAYRRSHRGKKIWGQRPHTLAAAGSIKLYPKPKNIIIQRAANFIHQVRAAGYFVQAKGHPVCLAYLLKNFVGVFGDFNFFHAQYFLKWLFSPFFKPKAANCF